MRNVLFLLIFFAVVATVAAAIPAFAKDPGALEFLAADAVDNSMQHMSEITSHNNDYCPPQPPPQDNRFNAYKKKLGGICRTAHLSSCENFVEDYFEIAAPSCLDVPDPARVASTCTMGTAYLFKKINEDPAYQNAMFNFDALIEKLKNGTLSPVPQTQYELALKAANGNRAIAIFLMSSDKLLSTGYMSLVAAYRGKFKDKKVEALLGKWADSSPFEVFLNRLPPLPELSVKSDISALAADKSYHFWARAFLSSQLKEKGYFSLLAATSSAASAVYYEYFLDWNEHKDVPVRKRVLNASKDIHVAAEGAEFGVGMGIQRRYNNLVY